MIRYRASWVVPIASPPIPDGWVEVDAGRVVRVGSSAHDDPARMPVVDLASTIVLPSLVNAHTHLELSALHSRIAPASRMPDWARQVMAQVGEIGTDDEAVRTAVHEMWTTGTGLVGDISNTLASVRPLAESPVDGVVFKELLGFNVTSPAAAQELVAREWAAMSGVHRPQLSLAAHAPYSVSPALFRAIAAAVDDAPVTVHLAESTEELEFLRSGGGPWRAVLEERGRWEDTWRPHTGGPVDYLARLGWIRPRTLVVHGVHLTDPELSRLAAAGVTLVTCPRSNQWTGSGRPPVERFYASGVPVAVGTDSLASAPDLNLFGELAELRRLAPDVPATSLLRSATLTGAQALGRDDRGVIQAGKRASLITVRHPEGLEDVEEYLVRGIDAEQVGWIEGGPNDSRLTTHD